ncbi:MAG TPA: right-handed parallel beta-helix repeat-containing protein [Gemmatimonadales bacterium]|nr:right-handed parallel beta-helix repeat-containing protein [Gemmatimonadales bacterium]
MVVTRSTRITPGTYHVTVPAADSALIVVRGEGVTLDLRGVTFEGLPPAADPDQAEGVAIRIEGGRDVRVLGGALHGYRIGLLALGTRRLTVTGTDASGSWRPRLFSRPEHESLVDWLSFHHNEHDEWRRFGAGLYLQDVRGGAIRGVTARRGMNALLLVRSDSLRIEGNDLSFNSGLGIGMYRASDNVIVRNRVDYDVRGYSHGVYRRGQDSAGILMFEQCRRNVVAYNSVTHGGDGLFLWAGQQTMDDGHGGANDNLFLGNDFSWAPTNGMEATFSRNAFIANRISGSDHGLWGGYSYESPVVGNCFSENRIGIAIEHGQDLTIQGNTFTGDATAIRLWADPVAPSDWGYPKHRDTRSRDIRIEGNRFARHGTAIRVSNTERLVEHGNTFADADTFVVIRDTLAAPRIRLGDHAGRPAAVCRGVPAIPRAWRDRAPRGSRAVPSTPLALRDRGAIVMGEWGPYDWSEPLLYRLPGPDTAGVRLAILGPAGRWQAAERRGVAALSRTSGRVGDTIVVTPRPDSLGDWSLTLRTSGGPATYTHFVPIAGWDARYVAWGDSTDPRTRAEAFDARFAGTPLLARRERALDLMWYRPEIRELPQERWGLAATTSVELPDGGYTLRAISDDGIRVWVDGALAIDHWAPHESLVDNVPLAPGRHAIRVEYYQVDGWVELRVEIVRGTLRSTGSPGPH